MFILEKKGDCFIYSKDDTEIAQFMIYDERLVSRVNQRLPELFVFYPFSESGFDYYVLVNQSTNEPKLFTMNIEHEDSNVIRMSNLKGNVQLTISNEAIFINHDDKKVFFKTIWFDEPAV